MIKLMTSQRGGGAGTKSENIITIYADSITPGELEADFMTVI